MLPSRKVPPEARAAYRLDRKASLLAGVYTGGIFPFIGIIARDNLHANANEISILTAAPFLGFLLAIFYANAVEGRQKIRSMVGPYLIARVILLATAFTHTSLAFVLMVSAAQVVAGLAGPAAAAVLKEIYPDSSRGRIMSYNRVAWTLTSALVAVPAGWMIARAGYQLVFPIAAIVGIYGSFTYLRIGALYKDRWAPEPAVPLAERLRLDALRASAGRTRRFLVDTFAIFGEDRNYRWFALSVFTYGFGNLMIGPLVPIYQVDRLHINTAQVGVLSQVAQVTGILAYFYWGRFVDLRSPLRGVVINVLLNACIPLLYFYSHTVWDLVPVFVLYGITNAGIDLSYFNSILTFAKDENVARYQALHSFLLGIRGTIAPFAGVGVMHALAAHGKDTKYLFLIGMVLILAGCWMQVMGVRTRYETAQSVPAPGGRETAVR